VWLFRDHPVDRPLSGYPVHAGRLLQERPRRGHCTSRRPVIAMTAWRPGQAGVGQGGPSNPDLTTSASTPLVRLNHIHAAAPAGMDHTPPTQRHHAASGDGGPGPTRSMTSVRNSEAHRAWSIRPGGSRSPLRIGVWNNHVREGQGALPDPPDHWLMQPQTPSAPAIGGSLPGHHPRVHQGQPGATLSQSATTAPCPPSGSAATTASTWPSPAEVQVFQHGDRHTQVHRSASSIITTTGRYSLDTSKPSPEQARATAAPCPFALSPPQLPHSRLLSVGKQTPAPTLGPGRIGHRPPRPLETPARPAKSNTSAARRHVRSAEKQGGEIARCSPPRRQLAAVDPNHNSAEHPSPQQLHTRSSTLRPGPTPTVPPAHHLRTNTSLHNLPTRVAPGRCLLPRSQNWHVK